MPLPRVAVTAYGLRLLEQLNVCGQRKAITEVSVWTRWGCLPGDTLLIWGAKFDFAITLEGVWRNSHFSVVLYVSEK